MNPPDVGFHFAFAILIQIFGSYLYDELDGIKMETCAGNLILVASGL